MISQGPQYDWRKIASTFVHADLDHRERTIRDEITRRDLRHKRRKRIGLISLGILSLIGVGAIVSMTTTQLSPPKALPVATVMPAPPTPHAPVPLVKSLHHGTKYTTTLTADTRYYRLVKGAIRLRTRASAPRRLIVKVGRVVIEDIGTVFTVEALGDNRARVSVEEGRVKVSWPEGSQYLDVDESGEFPPVRDLSASNTKPQGLPKWRKPTPADDWRELAKSGQYRQAFALLSQHPGKMFHRVDDLLLAADVMRFSGQARQAVTYLETVITHHHLDPRRALASFTLGRVFLDELGEPLEAAKAFAAVRRDKGPLAEKALAREVEAWSKAGETGRAKEKARQYLQQYPKGDRVAVVRAFGGLDAP